MWKVFDGANNDRRIVLCRALNDLAINLCCELGSRCIDYPNRIVDIVKFIRANNNVNNSIASYR